MKKLWTCPKCQRKFAKTNQSHSCNAYPLKKHFEGKEQIVKQLYSEIIKKVKKEIGPFRFDSVSCCIRLVKNFAFAAVIPMKDKIRVGFTLKYLLKNSRVFKHAQISANRHNYRVEIKSKKEIDEELMNWLKQAYSLRRN
ncbi:hypothetical protein ISS85_03415 [Candidatus Microgenomates bacterium]|nr:hypothetical protein [Candidatus Microgenomates bacterium]